MLKIAVYICMRFSEFLKISESFVDTSDLLLGLEIEVPVARMPRSMPGGGFFDMKNNGHIDKFMQLSVFNQCNLPWKAGYDMSCKPGFEIKFEKPINATEQNLQTLHSDIEKIRQFFSGELDSQPRPMACGTHIHVGGMPPERQDMMLKLWHGKLQRYLKHLMHKGRYDNIASGSNDYVKMVSSMGDYEKLKKMLTLSPREDLGSLEWRALQSTLKPDLILFWVKAILRVCALCEKLMTNFNSRELPSQIGISSRADWTKVRSMVNAD